MVAVLTLSVGVSGITGSWLLRGVRGGVVGLLLRVAATIIVVVAAAATSAVITVSSSTRRSSRTLYLLAFVTM